MHDYDNKFFRMVSIALAKTMNKSLRWINYFEPQNDNETGRIRVSVPFYTSLTGDERFVFDLFVDDVVNNRVTMNTDQYQRGIITFNNFSTKSDEFANPNQYLAQKKNINGDMRKIISKVKAVPVSISYDIEIQLATQNEVDKCSQKILNMLFNYMYFNIDYYGIKLDAVLKLPDDKTIEIQREVNMESDRKKIIKFSLDISTYYPIFTIDSDDLIICDNDDSIDWDYLEIPRPTEDFIESIKGYNNAFNFKNIKGSGSTEKEGMTAIKSVYWESYYRHINKINTDKDDIDPKQWESEDLQ